MKFVLVALMCVSLASSPVEANQSKVATQKSNAQVLDATTRWLAATIIKSGGEKYADEQLRYLISFKKASFKKGFGYIERHVQRFVDGEMLNDQIEETTFDLKRLDARTVSVHEYTTATSNVKNKSWSVVVESRVPADALAVQTKRKVKVDQSSLNSHVPGKLSFPFPNAATAQQFSRGLAFAISIS